MTDAATSATSAASAVLVDAASFLGEAGASVGGGAALGAFLAFCIVVFLDALGYDADRQTYLFYGGGLGGAVGAISLLYAG